MLNCARVRCAKCIERSTLLNRFSRFLAASASQKKFYVNYSKCVRLWEAQPHYIVYFSKKKKVKLFALMRLS